MSSKIQTQQICAAIRVAAASSSNRFETESPVTVIDSYDDETYEFWSFGFPIGMGEKLSIQSCTCTCCGNYLVSPMGNLVSKSALCSCEHGFRDSAENEKKEKKQRCNEMTKWDGFDAFVKVVLPEGAPDRLCEDVIGEIMRFL
jgi:hypothetical protein